MSGPAFFQTLMGRQFYESTLPKFVKEVGRVATAIERLAAALETAAHNDMTKEEKSE